MSSIGMWFVLVLASVQTERSNSKIHDRLDDTDRDIFLGRGEPIIIVVWEGATEAQDQNCGQPKLALRR